MRKSNVPNLLFMVIVWQLVEGFTDFRDFLKHLFSVLLDCVFPLLATTVWLPMTYLSFLSHKAKQKALQKQDGICSGVSKTWQRHRNCSVYV